MIVNLILFVGTPDSMGDSEPSKKRGALRELSRGLDSDDDTCAFESGTFKTASEEVLATRRILRVDAAVTNKQEAHYDGIRSDAPKVVIDGGQTKYDTITVKDAAGEETEMAKDDNTKGSDSVDKSDQPLTVERQLKMRQKQQQQQPKSKMLLGKKRLKMTTSTLVRVVLTRILQVVIRLRYKERKALITVEPFSPIPPAFKLQKRFLRVSHQYHSFLCFFLLLRFHCLRFRVSHSTVILRLQPPKRWNLFYLRYHTER